MDDLFASQPIAGATLARSDIERLIGKGRRTLIDCDLEEADLSGLDLTRWRFERCNLRRSDLAGAKLEGTVWQSCRGPFANFSGANLSEAEFIGGDWNNCAMRR
ncbi:MAG: pentapeptide repeat-containing protein, partial [Proteobacteria bacterium]|nr:pentapeptide repeat-containing protein [Pseudomonadota bacterium]